MLADERFQKAGGRKNRIPGKASAMRRSFSSRSSDSAVVIRLRTYSVPVGMPERRILHCLFGRQLLAFVPGEAFDHSREVRPTRRSREGCCRDFIGRIRTSFGAECRAAFARHNGHFYSPSAPETALRGESPKTDFPVLPQSITQVAWNSADFRGGQRFAAASEGALKSRLGFENPPEKGASENFASHRRPNPSEGGNSAVVHSERICAKMTAIPDGRAPLLSETCLSSARAGDAPVECIAARLRKRHTIQVRDKVPRAQPG